MKEQQAEIKERQKAIRQLQRQVQVLEGAQHKMQERAGRGSAGSEPHTPLSPKRGGITRSITEVMLNASVSLDDIDSFMFAHKENAISVSDSKGLLRGAQAQK